MNISGINFSEPCGEIAAALAAAQALYKPVPKNKTAKVRMKSGGEYSYKYADLADVLSMALPVLASQGLAFLQPTKFDDKHGSLVVSVLLHKSGQWAVSDGTSVTQTSDKQLFGSELSYARRYDGCSLLGITPDEDEDGKAATENARDEKKVAKEPAKSVNKPPVKPPVRPPTTTTVAAEIKRGETTITDADLDALGKGNSRLPEDAAGAEAFDNDQPLSVSRNEEIQQQLTQWCKEKKLDKRRLMLYLEAVHQGKRSVEVPSSQWETTFVNLTNAVEGGESAVNKLFAEAKNGE